MRHLHRRDCNVRFWPTPADHDAQTQPESIRGYWPKQITLVSYCWAFSFFFAAHVTTS
jgi:hypothetical protein